MSKNDRIRDFISQIVAESIDETFTGLFEDEREKQAVLSKKTSKLPGGKKKGDVDEAEDQEDEENSDDEKRISKGTAKTSDTEDKNVVLRPEEVTEVDIYEIIDLLNQMRSGKSLKDEDTRKRVQEYFDGLDPGERQSLLIYVTALTEIMSGGISGKDADDPTDLGVETEPIRKKEQPTPQQTVAREKTSGSVPKKDEDTPIVVGEVARKGRIIRRYQELSR
jgi:hypothetical protein